jgi:hypothetical protein
MLCPLKDMLRILVEIIGGPEVAEPEDMEVDEAAKDPARQEAPVELAGGRMAQCAAMARVLLNLILEMFGALPCP